MFHPARSGRTLEWKSRRARHTDTDTSERFGRHLALGTGPNCWLSSYQRQVVPEREVGMLEKDNGRSWHLRPAATVDQQAGSGSGARKGGERAIAPQREVVHLLEAGRTWLDEVRPHAECRGRWHVPLCTSASAFTSTPAGQPTAFLALQATIEAVLPELASCFMKIQRT